MDNNVEAIGESTPNIEAQPIKKPRYNLIDALRGLALISMIIYHASWDLVYMFGVKWQWYGSEGARIWQQSICWTFILLSGFSYNLGRKHIRRGATVFLGGAVVSLVTLIFMPSSKIIFGILTCIGSCMLLTYPLEKLLRKCNAYIGAVISFLLFAFTYGLSDRYLGFFDFKLIKLPEVLYRNYFTAYLGLPAWGFSSTDYFPIIPWIFLFISGYFIFHIMKKHDLLKLLVTRVHTPLEWIGKHTLPIYMIHQPIIYLICMIIFK